MTRRRALRAVAVGVVLAGLTLTTFTGLLFQRPLPTIDGHFRLLGLHERAEVVRDVFGVPRIKAGDAHDLFFLQGYVTAQDRFAQMDAMRLAASLSDLETARAPVASAAVRDALTAYASGVTKWIAQHAAARALPAEAALSGRRPPHWTTADTLAIVARYFGGLGRSRCIAVTGQRTVRGAPLLAAELISEATAPGWYEIGLEDGGIRAIGLSLPGVPGILAGHNGGVAWSLTRAVDEVALLTAMEASTVADLDVRLMGCAVDTRGAVVGAVIDGAHFDVEAMRLTLGRTASADASARIVIDLGDLDASKAAVSTGQSGHRAAFHYRDQVPLWEAGQLHRLAWTRSAVARTEGQLVFRAR